MECLNTILSFINEHSDKCIIIFAGYEDLLQKTIFKAQPGLQRRIGWNFKIDKYTYQELFEILKSQFNENWKLIDDDKILNLFRENYKSFKFFGGDTLRLSMYTKNVYNKFAFERLVENKEINSNITYEMVKEGFEMLTQNQNVLNERDNGPPPGMYI